MLYQNNQMMPNYYGQMGQMPQYDNYYQNRMNFLQGQMNSNQMTGNNNVTTGKIVDSVELVKAADIPMDGNLYYFPKADGKAVYGKRWLPNATTEIITYAREEGGTPDAPETSHPVPLEGQIKDEIEAMQGKVLESINALNERMGKIEKALVQKPSVKARKEDES